MSSGSNWSVVSVVPGKGMAFLSPMLFVARACQGSFCEKKVCDLITSEVKQKTNTIIFTVSFISLVTYEEIGSVKRPAIRVEIYRWPVQWSLERVWSQVKEENLILCGRADLTSFRQWLSVV